MENEGETQNRNMRQRPSSPNQTHTESLGRRYAHTVLCPNSNSNSNSLPLSLPLPLPAYAFTPPSLFSLHTCFAYSSPDPA